MTQVGENPTTPFEEDILDQPRALHAFLDGPRPSRVTDRPAGDYDRIILTGMGSSHFAGLRAWRRLAAARLPAWWVSTDELLDSLELITEGSLVLVTSQSGASGETAALLQALAGRRVPPEVVGITNDPGSPLGRQAETLVELRSGTEATVSTKSYVNSLAAHEWLSTGLLGGDWATLEAELDRALAATSMPGLDGGADLAHAVVEAEVPRLAFIGAQDHLATALLGGLVVKEATKLPAEGFTGGSFRHGPLEIAGPGLTALFFGLAGEEADSPLRRLALDVEATGATVVPVPESSTEGGDGLAALVHGAIVCQWFSVALARARGIIPGEFHYGTKVTAL
jgi:glucosamine--fructose-6-phosphate aminotransferase (isomerizing)